MNYFNFKQEYNIKQQQTQRLSLSMEMQQALQVLQMPVIELVEWLKLQIEQNPLLEYIFDEDSSLEQNFSSEQEELNFEKSGFDVLQELDESFGKGLFDDARTSADYVSRQGETIFPYQTSLFEHLMNQARHSLQNEKEIALAEMIIGNLDERGFLSLPLQELSADIVKLQDVLKKVQTFDPPGIAAKNIKESLMIQLRLKGKECSLAYRLIDEHFDDLLRNRLPLIRQRLKCSNSLLRSVIAEDIAILDLHPGHRFIKEPVLAITPDFKIDYDEAGWHVEVNEESLPRFRLKQDVSKAFFDPSLKSDQKAFIYQYLSSGKWLMHITQQRAKTLHALADIFIKKQKSFLSGETKCVAPMTMQEVAEELCCHESTVARAVSHKYLSCPQGVFPLRDFFRASIKTDTGDFISNESAKSLLLELVKQESKGMPLSDALLSDGMRKRGVPCARRTVAKYRKLLKIPSATQRRKWD
ncbi:MAG: RNA polymerase factor sigma-54 [Anaerolineae bacterium]